MQDSGTKMNRTPMRIALVGTSPLSLLKSLQLARQFPDAQITLFDAGASTGGAWYSDLSPKGHEIECGCHIWSYVPKAYQFIEQELGIPLMDVRPAPVFVGKKIKVPYSLKNTVDTYQTFFRTLFSLRWNRFKNFTADPNMNFRIFYKRNRYPKLGSVELMHTLLKKVSTHPGISVLLNTTIDAYDIHQHEVQLTTTQGIFHFDQIFLTYVSQLKKITIQDKPVEFKYKHVDYIHFLVQMDKPLLKKLSYWRLINDPIVHRITDISNQTGFEENLILIGIKDHAYHKTDEVSLLQHCRNLFEQYGLVDASFSFERIKTHIFPTYYLDETILEALKKCEPAVHLMHTTDIMHGVYFLLNQNEKTSAHEDK